MPLPSALLPPDASARDTRSLQSWGCLDCEELAAKVQSALQAWKQAYDLTHDETGTGVICESAPDLMIGRFERMGHEWSALSAPSEPELLWWTLGGERFGPSRGVVDAQHGLFTALFGEPYTPFQGQRLADDMAMEAWSDWWARLGSFFGVSKGLVSQPSDLPVAILRPWSGAVAVTLPWFGQAMVLVLRSERASQALNRQASRVSPPSKLSPLTPLLSASSSLALPLRVEMEPIEVDLGTLVSLRLGDVLRTTHALDMPLIVKGDTCLEGPDSSEYAPGLCDGFLGKREGWRAVELLRKA